MECLACGG